MTQMSTRPNHRFAVKAEVPSLSLQRSDMSIEGDTSNLRAPEERNVYSTAGRAAGCKTTFTKEK